MTQQEINTMIYNLVNEKCIEGFDRMKDMPMCESLFNGMVAHGFAEQALTFKSIVFLTTILHPDWSDMDILTNFAKEIGGKQ